VNYFENKTMKTEEFADILGYEGFYKINIHGQVKIVGRVIARGVRVGFCKEKIMKIHDRCGYIFVILSKNRIRKSYSIHRLIAINFMPNPNNFPVINHINGIRTDNRIENLEWCTQSANVQHSYDMGFQVAPGQKQVYCSLTGKDWPSITKCALDIGVSRSLLGHYLSGKLKNKTTIKFTNH